MLRPSPPPGYSYMAGGERLGDRRGLSASGPPGSISGEQRGRDEKAGTTVRPTHSSHLERFSSLPPLFHMLIPDPPDWNTTSTLSLYFANSC